MLALSPKIQTNYELLSDSEDRQLSCSIEERELAISSMIADGVPKILYLLSSSQKIRAKVIRKHQPSQLRRDASRFLRTKLYLDSVKTQETQRAIHETLDTFPECSDEPVRRKHATGTKRS